MLISAVGVQLGVMLVILGAGIFVLFSDRFPSRSKATRLGFMIAGGLALILTWYAVFQVVRITLLGMVTRWGLKHSFFRSVVVQHLITSVVTILSIGIFVKGMVRTPNSKVRLRLPLVFAATNVAFLLSSFLFLPNILTTGLLLVLLLGIQWTVAAPLFWKYRSFAE